MNTPAPTHYELLGVEKDATAAEIKTAWRRVLQFAHPDKGAPAGLFRSLEMAYQILADEHQRAVYDRSLAGPAEPEPEPAYDVPPRPAPRPAAPTGTAAGSAWLRKEPPVEPEPEIEASAATKQTAVRIRPGYSHGLIVLLAALLADLAVTWIAGFPVAALGALALALAANLRFRDIRAQMAAFGAAAALAGYQFAQHWQLLVGTTKMLTLTHLGILAVAHVVLCLIATGAGYVFGQTLRLNRVLPKKILSGYRVFGKRGGGRHWQETDVALETARTVELAMDELPGATVLHGLRVMNGDEALFVDHALLLGERIVLIQGARLGSGRHTMDGAGQYLRNDRYFPNNFDELDLAAAVVKKAVQRRAKISTLILTIAADGVQLDAPGMIADRELSTWLIEHFAGQPPVIDRVILRQMSAHLLP